MIITIITIIIITIMMLPQKILNITDEAVGLP